MKKNTGQTEPCRIVMCTRNTDFSVVEVSSKFENYFCGTVERTSFDHGSAFWDERRLEFIRNLFSNKIQSEIQ